MPMRTMRLPLRGLASEGANEIVGRALASLPGIVGIRASMANNLLEVDYDNSSTTEKQIHDALKGAGIVHGAHG